ncbi:MAG: transposase [Candidatus Gastranaerophilales bacterium]|nr:transposase [Candidatus Gastranaerophilales bacterium]
MSNYRRLFLDGYYVFITCVTFKRNPILIDNVEHLRNGFKLAKDKYNFEITAIVILKDHFHLILRPENINDYPKIIIEIKQYFSHNIINEKYLSRIKKYITPSMLKRNESGVWQRRYYEHTIKNDDSLNIHLDYIHYNPVKHGLVKNVKDWEFSSFNKYVKRGNYDINWGSQEKDIREIVQYDLE